MGRYARLTTKLIRTMSTVRNSTRTMNNSKGGQRREMGSIAMNMAMRSTLQTASTPGLSQGRFASTALRRDSLTERRPLREPVSFDIPAFPPLQALLGDDGCSIAL